MKAPSFPIAVHWHHCVSIAMKIFWAAMTGSKANLTHCPRKISLYGKKAVGLTYQPCLLPLDADLRQQGLIKPASQYGHDWMHCFCSSGCMNVAIYYFFEVLPKETSWNFVGTYIQKWTMPKALNATGLHLLFADKKIKGYKEKGKFTAQASEVLALMPVIVHFCKPVVEPAKVAPLTCKAFLAVATVLFLLSEGQQAGITTPTNLQEAMVLMLTTCFAAEWDLIPKFHWGLHMPFQLQRWGKLLSCFTCERKNKIVKNGETQCATLQILKAV